FQPRANRAFVVALRIPVLQNSRLIFVSQDFEGFYVLFDCLFVSARDLIVRAQEGPKKPVIGFSFLDMLPSLVKTPIRREKFAAAVFYRFKPLCDFALFSPCM